MDHKSAELQIISQDTGRVPRASRVKTRGSPIYYWARVKWLGAGQGSTATRFSATRKPVRS